MFFPVKSLTLILKFGSAMSAKFVEKITEKRLHFVVNHTLFK